MFFSLLIFPQAGPDIKYLLGFIRTQLSTSVTVALVFGPKVRRKKILLFFLSRQKKKNQQINSKNDFRLHEFGEVKEINGIIVPEPEV